MAAPSELPSVEDAQQALEDLSPLAQALLAQWQDTFPDHKQFIHAVDTEVEKASICEVADLMQSFRRPTAIIAFSHMQYNVRWAFRDGPIEKEKMKAEASLALWILRNHVATSFQEGDMKRDGKAIYLHDGEQAPFDEFIHPERYTNRISHGVDVRMSHEGHSLVIPHLRYQTALLVRKNKASSSYALMQVSTRVTDKQICKLKEVGLHRNAEVLIVHGDSSAPIQLIQDQLWVAGLARSDRSIPSIHIPSAEFALAVQLEKPMLLVDFLDKTQYMKADISRIFEKENKIPAGA